MRNHQARFGQTLAAIQNQVEVQRAGSPGRRPLSPVASFNLQQPVEQRPRRERGATHNNPIQVARLIGNANGGGVEPG